jgi:hypothetical protein
MFLLDIYLAFRAVLDLEIWRFGDWDLKLY